MTDWYDVAARIKAKIDGLADAVDTLTREKELIMEENRALKDKVAEVQEGAKVIEGAGHRLCTAAEVIDIFSFDADGDKEALDVAVGEWRRVAGDEAAEATEVTDG